VATTTIKIGTNIAFIPDAIIFGRHVPDAVNEALALLLISLKEVELEPMSTACLAAALALLYERLKEKSSVWAPLVDVLAMPSGGDSIRSSAQGLHAFAPGAAMMLQDELFLGEKLEEHAADVLGRQGWGGTDIKQMFGWARFIINSRASYDPHHKNGTCELLPILSALNHRTGAAAPLLVVKKSSGEGGHAATQATGLWLRATTNYHPGDEIHDDYDRHRYTGRKGIASQVGAGNTDGADGTIGVDVGADGTIGVDVGAAVESSAESVQLRSCHIDFYRQYGFVPVEPQDEVSRGCWFIELLIDGRAEVFALRAADGGAPPLRLLRGIAEGMGLSTGADQPDFVAKHPSAGSSPSTGQNSLPLETMLLVYRTLFAQLAHAQAWHATKAPCGKPQTTASGGEADITTEEFCAIARGEACAVESAVAWLRRAWKDVLAFPPT
jgi:hypothetical protein